MNNRTYSVNENFFKKWNRHMAYILGFFIADGHLDDNSISFEIHARDIDALKYIKNAMDSEHPISVRRQYCRFRVHSMIIANDLKSLFNITHNKTYNYEIRYNIPPKFIGDFIRGYFDGDGWVCNRRNAIETGFCSGSNNLIKNVHSLIDNIGKIRACYKKGNSNPCYQINIGTNDSIKLRSLIYKNEPFCLQRKKEKFWNFYTPSKKYWTKAQLKTLKENRHMPIPELSKIIGKSEKSVQMKKFKLGLCPKKPNNWKWTKREDDIVKSNTVDAAMQAIGRTKVSILARRHKFGIFKIKPWEDNKVVFLLDNWFKSRKWISQQINEPEERIKTKIMLLRKLGKIPPRKTGRPKIKIL